MAKRRWQSRLGLIFLSLALVAMLNPELRAGLLVIESIGLDLAVLLMSMQLRAMAPLLQPLLVEAGRIATSAGLYLYRSILPTLLCMLWPRLAPFALGMLLFICAASELHVRQDEQARLPWE